jgi:hypothetical protein
LVVSVESILIGRTIRDDQGYWWLDRHQRSYWLLVMLQLQVMLMMVLLVIISIVSFGHN